VNGADKQPVGNFAEGLRRRTKAFSFEILKLCRRLPKSEEARMIGKQLLRAGMSVGANYRAVSRARSTAEFISKINVVIEETDETLFWLEALAETGTFQDAQMESLLREGDEILRILVASQRTARKRPAIRE
jgi:four helix bundle protein